MFECVFLIWRGLQRVKTKKTRESISDWFRISRENFTVRGFSLVDLCCPQIWNIVKEKDREREKVGRQASEAQREKEPQRERKNKRRHFLLEEQDEIL